MTTDATAGAVRPIPPTRVAALGGGSAPAPAMGDRRSPYAGRGGAFIAAKGTAPPSRGVGTEHQRKRRMARHKSCDADMHRTRLVCPGQAADQADRGSVVVNVVPRALEGSATATGAVAIYASSVAAATVTCAALARCHGPVLVGRHTTRVATARRSRRVAPSTLTTGCTGAAIRFGVASGGRGGTDSGGRSNLASANVTTSLSIDAATPRFST